MKKTITIAVLSFVISAGTVLAAAPVIPQQWINNKTLDKGLTQRIYSSVLDSNEMGVVKFQDGEHVCYIAFQTYGGHNYTPSMQCNFK